MSYVKDPHDWEVATKADLRRVIQEIDFMRRDLIAAATHIQRLTVTFQSQQRLLLVAMAAAAISAAMGAVAVVVPLVERYFRSP